MYVWVCTRSTALSERGVGVEVRGHHSLSVSLESNAGCSSVPVITPISSHLPKPCSRSRSHSFLPAKSFWNLLLFSSSKGSLCLQECRRCLLLLPGPAWVGILSNQQRICFR